MNHLLAELHNKISQNGSNLSDRLEDQLTGDFFGTIRYLPFEAGLKTVLSSVKFDNFQINQDWNNLIQSKTGYAYKMTFWYRHHEGEIDLLVQLKDSIIGIEIKYLSGISSEDEEIDININYEESCNQLAKYSRMLTEIKGDKTPYLLFLAPYNSMHKVKKSLQNRSIIAPEVKLGFLTWEDVLESLTKLEFSQFETGQKLIIQDLIALLRKKRFMRYKGIPMEILGKQISNEPYHFQSNKEDLIEWSWPAKLILEENSYVFGKK